MPLTCGLDVLERISTGGPGEAIKVGDQRGEESGAVRSLRPVRNR